MKLTKESGLAALVCGASMIMMANPAVAAECVKPSGAGSCFTTIQEAVDAADPGETVRISPGTYFENVMIPEAKDGLQLIGTSRTRVILDPDAPNTGNGITVAAPNVLIKNITIQNGNSDAIHIDSTASGTRVERVDFYRPEDECVDVYAPDVEIVRNKMYGCDDPVEADNNADNLLIDRNTMLFCDGDCIDVGSSGDSDQLTGVVITRNRIEQAEDSDGIDLTGDDFEISRNTLENVAEGIDVDCDPCLIGGIIERNIIRNITDDGTGIEVDADSSGISVIRNRVENTNDEAYDIEGVGIYVAFNTARFTGGDQGESGFEVSGEAHTLFKNTSFFSVNDGFHIDGSDHFLDGNVASQNLGDGIDLDGASDVTVRNSRVTNNRGEGIEVSEGSDDAFDNVIESNRASGNRVDFCDEGINTTVADNNFGTTGDCEVGD